MFTEQPAPPSPVTEVQVQRADATLAQTDAPVPAASRVATPEALPTPVAEPVAPPAPAPVAEPTPAPAPTPSAAPAAPAVSAEAAKAQRQREVEQTLLELTRKAQAQQQEQQQQQAAIDTAKYGEAGELEAAEKVINNPALPANVRAALMKRLQAKQGKGTLAQKPGKPGKPAIAPTAPTEIGRSQDESSNARDYTTAPLVPFSQAQLQARLGQLIGRNLNFAFPLSVSAPITSMFGWRIHPISGLPRFHRGIDFGAPIGTPIVAAKAGRVETAAALDGYGLTVVVQHGKTQQTLYAHLSQIYVQPGELVKKGQLLGLVGSTGNSTGPHLHFEIHEMTSEGWVALDPAIAMSGAIALAQNPQALQAAARKPQSFNLSLSGLLNLNLPSQTLPFFSWGNTVLSGLPLSTAVQPADLSGSGLQVSLSLLPPALPELGWLLSPFVETLTSELAIALPGIVNRPQQFSFQALPALTKVPAAALQPQAPLPNPATVRLATTQSVPTFTIAQTAPTPGRVSPLPQSQALPTVRDRSEIPTYDLQRLQLSTRRVKPLDGG